MSLAGFEVFRRPRVSGRLPGPPLMTVTPKGLHLSSAAAVMLGEDIREVQIATEGIPARRVGLIPVAFDTPEPLRYRVTPVGRSRTISATAFVRVRSVPYGSFLVTKEDDMLIARVRS